MKNCLVLLLMLFLTVFLLSCGGGGGGSDGLADDQSGDVLPDAGNQPDPLTGSWYRPAVTTTWQWQLLGTVNTGYSVDLYDIDLFDTPVSTIASLKDSGKRVICYFSAGSYEDWRSDSGSFPSVALGTTLDGWANERWLDIRSATVRQTMLTRLDLAVAKGCDGVEPDNMDGYLQGSGFPLTAADQLDFNIVIAEAAHQRGLSVGLKNDLDQIP